MVQFIFTNLYLLLIVINTTSDAIKFQDQNPTDIDETKVDLDFIEDFDDVNERILTGNRHVRKKKHYANSASDENSVKKINKNHNGSINEKPYRHNTNENILDGEGSNQYTHNDRPSNGFTGNSERFGSASNEDVSNEFSNNGGDFQENFGGANGGEGNSHGSNGDTNNSDTGDTSNVLEQCIRDGSVGILPCISQKTVSFLERYSHNAKDISIEDNLVLSSNPDEVHQSRLIPTGE